MKIYKVTISILTPQGIGRDVELKIPADRVTSADVIHHALWSDELELALDEEIYAIQCEREPG